MVPDFPERTLGFDGHGSDGDGTGGDDEEAFVRFLFATIGEHRLAIDIDDVKTVTEYPENDLTTVPRSPEPVYGVVDLRGEITAVIEPRFHFPASQPPAADRSVIVFDRPADRQPASIVVDEVLGVETVPERNVFDESEIERRDLAGGAIDHPLIVGLIENERQPGLELSDVIGSELASETDRNQVDESGSSIADRLRARSVGDLSTGPADRSPAGDPLRSEEAVTGELFVDEFEDEVDEETTGDEDSEEILVEVTALLDVERLVAASGRLDSRATT